MRRDLRVAGLVGLFVVLGCIRVVAAGPVPMRLDLYPRGGVAELTFLGRVMGVYQYGEQERWPYVSAMAGWGGGMVLGEEGEWRGVGLGMEVEGVEFGVGGEGAGWVRVGPAMERLVGKEQRGRYVARLEHEVFWLGGEGRAREEDALLVERRRVGFLIEARRREVVMEWDSEFRVGGLKDEVVLGMGEGLGLRVRFVPGFSGVVLEGSGEAGGDGLGDGLVVRGELEGREMSVGLFGGVGKLGGVEWEVKRGAGLGLSVRPVAGVPGRLRRGETFRLKYWMVLRPGGMTAEELRFRREEERE